MTNVVQPLTFIWVLRQPLLFKRLDHGKIWICSFVNIFLRMMKREQFAFNEGKPREKQIFNLLHASEKWIHAKIPISVDTQREVSLFWLT